MQNENLGAAERILNSLLAFKDHMYHGRPGIVVQDGRYNGGVRWEPVTKRTQNGEHVVFRLVKAGKKTTEVRAGVLREPNSIIEGGRNVGTYRSPGLFPEVATWMYSQVAEVWKLDNEFAARWASYAFTEENRDLKVVLAAFMLVQSRKGDPVKDGDKVAFYDDDFRDVGEAMILLYSKDQKKTNLDAKLLLRIHDLLTLPQVAQINRDLGFGKSARTPFLGRWTKAVEKWLRYREENPKLLEGLVKAGYRTTVMELAQHVGYKPTSPKFFATLRWKQAQSKHGHRVIAIGQGIEAAESWEDLTEEAICQKIMKERPGFKRVTGLLPAKMGLTRAIMAAAIEAGSVSDKDLVILTPTLEDLGLLQVQDIQNRWQRAVKASEDTRAANIALKVKSKETKEALQDGADTALKKAVEEAVRGLTIYVFIDISGSMQASIEKAKEYISKFLQSFPLDKLHVAVFNTTGRKVEIKVGSKAGVENAFRGITAGGGTAHGAGIRVLQNIKPVIGDDTLFIFIGDEGEHGDFAAAVRQSGLSPMAFGLVKLPGDNASAVSSTAAALGIPCFRIDERTFEDAYAIPRTIRALVAATPVGQQHTAAPVKRQTLIDTILKTELLKKPAFAN